MMGFSTNNTNMSNQFILRINLALLRNNCKIYMFRLQMNNLKLIEYN